MKILIDMNLPPKLADMLTIRGYDSKHWVNVGAPDAKDTEIMRYAHQNDYIILTYDLDFSTILSISNGNKPSVVQLRIDSKPIEYIVDLLDDALFQSAEELKKGAVLTVDAKKVRLRLLPL